MDTLSEGIEECRISTLHNREETEEEAEEARGLLQFAKSALGGVEAFYEDYEYDFNDKAFDEVKSIAKRLCSIFIGSIIKIVITPISKNVPPLVTIEITSSRTSMDAQEYREFMELTKHAVSVDINGHEPIEDCWLKLFDISIEFDVFNID